jgi:hypothetical protein
MVLLMDNLKSMTQIWVSLGRHYNVHPRSLETFEKRVEGEGRQFLYKELTQLGRDFDRALIGGESFNTTARFGLVSDESYPVFLQELFKQVLDHDGAVRVDAPATIIHQIRQLTLLYYKVKVPHSEEAILEAVTGFVERDMGLNRLLPPPASTRKARGLIGRVLLGLDPFSTVPRHGSGSTSCRTANQDKYHSFRFIPRLDAVFPYDEFFFYNKTHFADSLQSLLDAEVIEEPTARIVAVPKDMRGPRLICCEPREHQYIQQGLMRAIYKRVEHHPLTRGYVNFRNQEVNRTLTLEASRTQKWATLDLKDASDRVRWDLVQDLFPGNWVKALDACRTRFVQVDEKTTYGPMRKFAPMGSAVCFPVEALIFWSLLRSHLGCDVYVYGDDIILPTARAEEAMHILEVYDLQVNAQKSCYKTPFRESCGIDCWAGQDVSYVKARTEFNASLESETSWVDFVNNIAKTEGWDLGHRLRNIVDRFWEEPHYCYSGGVYVPGREQEVFNLQSDPIRSLPLAYNCEPQAINSACFLHREERDLQRREALLPCIESIKTACRTHHKFHWNEMMRRELVVVGDRQNKGDSSLDDIFFNESFYTVGEYAEPNRTHKKYRWRPV